MYATEQREQVSDSLRVTVLPLPERGRPESFTGAVGRYRATARLDPGTLAAGDAAMLRVEIEGTGNVKTLPPPRLPQLDGVEIFPPSEDADVIVRGDRLAGVKRFSWVLVPEREGDIQLGPIEYSFFDPETGGYGVSRIDALTLSVDGVSDNARADAPDTALSRIRATPAPEGVWGFVRSPFYAAAQVVPLIALLAAFALRRRRTAPEVNQQTTRAQWESDLDALLRGTEDDRAFLGRLAVVVRHALAELAGRPVLRAADADRVAGELEGAGVPAHATRSTVALLQRVDHARFGDGGAAVEDRGHWVSEARAALGRVQAALRPAGAALSIAFLLLLLPVGAHAQADLTRTFRSGVGAYMQGDYAGAAGVFESYLRDQPADAAAWYNLGNAHRGTGEIGPAVLAWRRSLELQPRAGATRRNLTLVAGDAALNGAPARLSLSTPETALLLGLLWWVGACAAAIAVWRADPRIFRLSIGAAVLCALVVLAWLPHVLRAPAAVALHDPSPLLAGPAVGSDTVAVVRAGTAVRLIDRQGDWLRVRTSDRAEGWADATHFGEVRSAALDP
jgi:tetratricopeptide (TPR) repeat protein